MLKLFKGQVPNLVKHPFAFLALMKFMETVDDTVMLKKTITNEIKESINDIISTKTVIKLSNNRAAWCCCNYILRVKATAITRQSIILEAKSNRIVEGKLCKNFIIIIRYSMKKMR